MLASHELRLLASGRPRFLDRLLSECMEGRTPDAIKGARLLPEYNELYREMLAEIGDESDEASPEASIEVVQEPEFAPFPGVRVPLDDLNVSPSTRRLMAVAELALCGQRVGELLMGRIKTHLVEGRRLFLMTGVTVDEVKSTRPSFRTATGLA